MNIPRILLKNELGNIILELYLQQAPVTVANFLQYIDEGRFTGACFYRVVRMDNQPNNEIKIEVIQGGLKVDEHPLSMPAILHETTALTGIFHKDGVISMARNEPGTATSEFFISFAGEEYIDSEYMLSDINGKMITRNMIISAQTKVIIEGLPSAIYILKVKTLKAKSSYKIIKR